MYDTNIWGEGERVRGIVEEGKRKGEGKKYTWRGEGVESKLCSNRGKEEGKCEKLGLKQ